MSTLINNSIKKINLPTWSAPLALLVVCLISFGLLIPWLGFYWDDWPTIWYLHLLGPAGFRDVFSVDRPLLGWLFMATTSIFGESTIGWQFFGLLTRWITSLALWWTLRLLWPKRTLQVTWIALLFAVYPGFKQQYISVTYSNTWIIYTTYFLSVGLMIWAVRSPRWQWLLMGASWLLTAYTMFSDEYFFGLEFLRPALLWLALSDRIAERRRRLERVALRWVPYLMIMGFFLYWRIFLHVSPRGQIQIFDQLRQSPFAALLMLVERVIRDVFVSGIAAWGQVFDFKQMTNYGSGPTLLYLAILLVSIPLAIFYLAVYRGKEQADPDLITERPWALQSMGLGIYALLIAGIPFWVTNLPIDLRFPWDRFTLVMMLGTSLFWVGIAELLLRSHLQKAILLGLVIGLASGVHFQQANLFRREWNNQKAFFWQLVWRAPELKPGTTILSAQLPFTYYSDNSLTAPLNWIYAPDNSSRQMPYLFYNVESRLGSGLIDFQKGLPIYEPYRATSFTGTTSQVLAIYSEPPGCVKVVDPDTDAKLPQKPLYFSEILPLSDMNVIEAKADPPAKPPVNIFGPEPEHDWCFFYEKADLARQQGNWSEIVALGNQVFPRNDRLYEVNAPELIPFIEGYAHAGKWDRAQQLTREAKNLTFRMQRMLCDTWNRIKTDTPSSTEQQDAIVSAQKILQCSTP
jgi:hypothetical protein